MNNKQIFGYIGSIILFISVFVPLVSLPIVGSLNYLHNGQGDGVIILVLAIASFFFVFINQFKLLWFTGGISMALTSLTFITFQSKISGIKEQMESELSGNPFRGLADMAVQSIQLQWGWALLILGSGLLIAAAAIKENPLKTESLSPVDQDF